MRLPNGEPIRGQTAVPSQQQPLEPGGSQTRDGRAPISLTGSTELVVIQSTPFCNIDCDYCYLPMRHSTKRMSYETLQQIAMRLFSSPFLRDEVTVVWHAGEPLVLPVSYYEEAIQAFQAHNSRQVRVTFSFQTNGTLIDERWCEFFKRPNVRVGLSLDGPRHIHDSHRTDRRKRGTFDRVIRGLRLLQAAGVDPSVIMVVTREVVTHAEETVRFFAENGIGLVGFNPEEAEGSHASSSLHTAQRGRAAWRTFMGRALTTADLLPDAAPSIREFEHIRQCIDHPKEEMRSQDNIPMAILSFDWAGNVSTFSPELLTARHPPYGDFIFGNVWDDSLESILTNAKFRDVYGAILQGVDRCRQSCAYFQFCGGGSPSNKIAENCTFDSTVTAACTFRIKDTVDVSLDFLEGQYGLLSEGGGGSDTNEDE
jgi:uncharacterized protein